MVALTLTELNKRDNLKIFLSKIQNQEPFELIEEKKKVFNCDMVIIDNSDIFLLESLQNYIEKENIKALGMFYKNKQLLLKTKSNIELTSGCLLKTIEFGSVGFQKTYQKETKFFSDLSDKLKTITNDSKEPANLVFLNHLGKEILSINNILSVEKTIKIKGNYVKSDFEFKDNNNKSILWISHKDGNKANSFRQWSGIKEFETHPELVLFGKQIKKHYRNNIKKTNIGKKIKDKELKLNSLFGSSKHYGPNKVNLIVQGNLEFKKILNNTYSVTANYIFSPEQNMEDIPKEYEPILFASKLNLEPKRCSFGIQGCRGLIYPTKGKKIKLID